MSLQLLKSSSFIEVLNQKHRRKKEKKKKTWQRQSPFMASKIGTFYLFMVNLHLNGETL